jgi:putative PEP-CTERM system TPR-repeat lipoprotein
LAQLALDDDQTDAALEWLDKAAAADPTATRPVAVKVNVLLAHGRAQAAQVAVRELQSRAPNQPGTLEALARVREAMGDQASAIDAYRRLVSATPGSADAHRRLGQALLQFGNLQDAAASFQAATELAPDMVHAWRGRVEIKRRTEGVAAARQLASSLADRIDPIVASVIEADVLFVEGHHAEAADLYGEAFKERASSEVALRLAESLTQAGQAGQAVDVLKEWLAANPDDVAGHFALSVRLIQTGEFDAAIEQGERLLTIRDDHVFTLNNLAWLYDRRGDTQKALTYAQRAYELMPDRPEIVDTLGWLLWRQGDQEAAMPLLEQAWSGAPGHPEIGFHYATALAEQGRTAEAAEVLSEALKSPDSFPEREEAEQLAEQLN